MLHCFYTVLKNNYFVDCDKSNIITMFNKTRNDAFELFKRKNRIMVMHLQYME